MMKKRLMTHKSHSPADHIHFHDTCVLPKTGFTTSNIQYYMKKKKYITPQNLQFRLGVTYYFYIHITTVTGTEVPSTDTKVPLILPVLLKSNRLVFPKFTKFLRKTLHRCGIDNAL